MANDLTGDFDVVAEFAILAVNRVLAAMHRAERFPHSLAIRVDDNPPPGSKVGRRSIRGSVNEFGDATVNHNHIVTPLPWPGRLSPADPVFWALDGVLNTDVVGAFDPSVVPSKLQGRAQLQLAPPKIEVTGATGSNVTVKLPVMARYFPDPHTPRVAEFVRGELQITAPVDQVASPDPKNVRMIDVDIRGDKVSVNFDRKWSSQPVSAEDLAGVNQLIRNALKTSFLPSNATLPSNINYMQFKTLLGAQSAIGVLLNMVKPSTDSTGAVIPVEGGPSNPGSMNNVFLGAGDDFAFAAGREFILAAFDPVINNILSQPIPPVRVHVRFWGHATYTISLNSVTLDLQNGKIVLTIHGHAHTSKRRFPDFDFTAQLAFTLQVNGATADLVPGAISLHTSSWLVNEFAQDDAIAGIANARDTALTQKDADGLDAYGKVNRMLSADKNLGGFLNSLVGRVRLEEPIDEPIGFARSRPLRVSQVRLAYTSVEIKSAGIILHGSLAVLDWPPAHVEFQQISSTSGGGPGGVATVPGEGPEYSALNSWIPGGTIKRFEWSSQGQAQPFLDVNKFVLMSGTVSTPVSERVSAGVVSGAVATGAVSGTISTGAVSGYVPICLTVRGTRIASFGPEVEQPVSATFCGYTTVSILEGVVSAPGGAIPMVALTQPSPGGLVQVAGHASARADGAGGGTPNRIVYFADERTAGNLEFLLQALRESKREDAATAVIAVLAPDQLAKARYTEGVIYAEEQGGAWAGAFGVKTTRRPLTLIVGPNGNIAWQHEGALDSEKLAAALRKNLARGGPVRLGMLGSSLRIGWPAPNFLFELAPGRGLTLRKLAGPTILVFWKSASKPSIETVRDLQETTRVLAINDGEAPQLAKKAAAENGLSATIVTDPERSISLVYRVNVWPTIVFLDAFGLVRMIRYGRLAGEQVHPTEAKAAAAQSARKMA